MTDYNHAYISRAFTRSVRAELRRFALDSNNSATDRRRARDLIITTGDPDRDYGEMAAMITLAEFYSANEV